YKFDGKTPNWFHFKCFFGKQRPKSVDEIENFESLRYNDQKEIRQKIDESGSGVIVPPKKGAKRNAATMVGLQDYKVEYSKSGRASCRGCEQKILKDQIRISKKDFETEVGRRYGGQDLWHHLTCFAKLRSELGYFAGGDALPGFKSLKKDDQQEVKKQLPSIKQEDIPDGKKVKKEEDDPLEKEIEKQNEIMFKYRDDLKQKKIKPTLQKLLTANDQAVPRGEEEMLDRIADVMTFGALLPCPQCNGQFVFNKIGYICEGNLTEWTKCGVIEKTPPRRKFVVPKEIAADYPFLKKYKYVKRTRVIKEVSIPVPVKKEDEVDSKPKVEKEKPPLYEMQFVIVGKPPRGKEEIKKQITELGGKVITKISNTVMAVISTPEEVEKNNARMGEVRAADVHVVSEDFVDAAKNCSGGIPELVIEKSIADWGTDPNTRLPPETSKSQKSKSMYTKSGPSKIKMTVKGGSAVDPDSGIDHTSHVYSDGNDKYTVVLGLTDIQRKKNSFYKLQLLESDAGNRYWLFRSWGRIGTNIGDNKLEQCSSLIDAKSQFWSLYEEKTGNKWEYRDNFQKVPGRMFPIDIDYGDEDEDSNLEINSELPSKLAQPIQNLMKIIFDVKSMKQVMKEFELDTEKMPLGKLSKKQLQSAYNVLSELQSLIDKKGSQAQFIDATNRFYTFVPHSFGIDNPPVIDDEETIKKKVEMLENLMELEVAYSLMKTSDGDNSVDSYYEQLKTDIDILETESEEFNIIKEYVKNTHAPTHTQYDLEVLEAFKVRRQGEEKRYKPFRKLHNRKLLWHGSRKTNFAGILSQGLRIAPPEAPVTGYMFGKGIYFADMVSKSANYCCTNAMDRTGLMLLCEVALGDMYERTQADYIEKLPKGKHSCKGIGRTHPDPSLVKKINNVEVPIGKPTDISQYSSLLYNEYIVYDVAQVNIKYLLQMDFKYKY
ncbi:hypothetical protein AMK59_5757, partial [Oryctes borbonicus]